MQFDLLQKNSFIYYLLAGTRVNHSGVLAVSNYLGSSFVVGILEFILTSLYGFNYATFIDITIDISTK